MRPFSGWTLAVLAVLAAGCGGSSRSPVLVPSPRLVSLQVEAYDPVTGFVWEGVAVRMLEATVEWSGATLPNVDPGDFRFTGSGGSVVFDAADIGAARMGFVEDVFGRAVLEPDPFADEAWITVELSAPGSPTVLVDVPLSWRTPDAFVSIPFVP